MDPCQPTAQSGRELVYAVSFRASPVTPNNKEQNRVPVLEAQVAT